ncbi:MAG: hypothetical protein Q4A01_06590 [Coriobacteriales bacterium]|nr:hypothetical protein [Coriobacteriales bacterium]
MIDGNYNIQMDTPLGLKKGTLALRTEGGTVFADIDAPLIGKRQMEGSCEGDTFTAQGSGKVKLLGNVDYTLQGEVVGDDIHVDIHSSKGDFQIDGTRV